MTSSSNGQDSLAMNGDVELESNINSTESAGPNPDLSRRTHRRARSSTSFVFYKAPHVDDTDEKASQYHEARHLLQEAFPSLLVCLVGLIFAGSMMDMYQHWEVFTSASELFILVPILLNLKGNLEMNLAARLSTMANLGELDRPSTRSSLIQGNLALIQVQAMITGFIAGIFTFFLGILEHTESEATVQKSILVITSSMVAAAASSFVLGIFMCGVIVISRMLRIDPDNIACPMASSLGDVVTLGILAGFAQWFMNHQAGNFSLVILGGMILSVPYFAKLVSSNPSVKELLYTGWSPIILAMVISSFAGLVLEHYVETYKGLAMLTPILCGLAGNLGSIYASRVSTALHRTGIPTKLDVEYSLLFIGIPIHMLFLLIIWIFDMGHVSFSAAFALTYFAVAMLCTWFALKMGRWMTILFWKRGYDPDNYVLPYLTAIVDVICTCLLVLNFYVIPS